METDAVNKYKKICGDYFSQQGKTVLFDVAISDTVRWRPHVFAKNDEQFILDILDEELIPDFYMKKFIQARNAIPELKIYLGIVRQSSYLFEFLRECVKNGFGIYLINSKLKLLLEAAEPTVEGITDMGQLAIAYDKPYGNILSFKKCLRSCKLYLYWLERNLPKKVLETLYEAIRDGEICNVENIRLLRAIDDDIDTGFKDEFKKFKEEIAQKDICAELRVIVDKISKSIHGRYIYSKDARDVEIRFQLPPLNSLKADQWDTILTNVEVVPPFDDLWKKGLDILNSWEEIKTKAQEYSKNKAKILEREAKRLREREI